MAIYRGTYFSLPFALRQRANNVPLNITSWLFLAHFRVDPADATPALITSSAGGHWEITDAANGKVRLVLTEAQTATLPLGNLVADVLRTDNVLGDYRLFDLRQLPVMDPVTRNG